MKKIKKNQGITIIALVVTIIIMLILATVTIRIAFKGGLIDYTKKATGDMQNAINKEQEMLDGRIEENGVWYNSMEDYIAGIPSGSQGEEEIPELSHNWTRGTGDNIDEFTCSNCKKTYTMGQKINYEPSGSVTSTTITAEKSGLDKYYEKNNSSYPYEAVVDENGAQTIERQPAEWIVLGIEDTDKDGVNETLLITTKSPVGISSGTELYLYGAAGYNNIASYYDANGKKIEGELDRVCRLLYSNSEYGEARGMTIDDVNKVLNYIPYGGEYYENNTWKTTGNLTTKLKNLPTWNTIKQNCHTPDGRNTEEALGEYELRTYSYRLNDNTTGLINNVNDTTKSLTEIEKIIVFGTSEEYDYCLASRSVGFCCFYPNFDPNFVYFGHAFVFGTVSFSGSYLFRSDGAEGGYNAFLRPVVSLLYDIPTSE